jgi:D-amino-acid dehydrogenase
VDEHEVVVVGGGAIGVCCALELARRGAGVTLLERGEELASGASSGNAGLLCPSHSAPIANPESLRNGLRWMLSPDSPFFLRPRPSVAPWLARFVKASTQSRAAEGTRIIRELSLAGLELHAELASEGLATGFERRGILNVYESESGFAHARAHADSIGVPCQVLDRHETRRLEPAVGGRIAGGVYFPNEAHCDPLGFVYAVGRAAKEAGATIETQVGVHGLARANGGIAVATSKGTLQARTVVLAAGAWTTPLVTPLGVCLPQEGGKGYHLDLEPAKDDPQVPISMDEAHVIATPLPGRLRLSGTLELSGLDASISRTRVDAIRRAAARVLEIDEERPELEVWAGLRPCTPDGLPVIGRPTGVEPLLLATGHARKGLSLAPITGRLVAELYAGEPPSIDLAPLSPDRFRPLLPQLRR